MQHDIKIKQCHLIHILENKKSFEVRKNDRDYQVGDTIYFMPLKDEKYDYSSIQKTPLPEYLITYLHSGLGLKEDYVVLGIQAKEKESV